MFLRSMTIAASLLIGAGSATALTPGIGETVSDSTFTTAYGQTLRMADLRGEVVVLTYWARDYKVCQEQLKALDYYYRQRPDVGLRVLAISADGASSRELRQAFRGKRIYALANIQGPFAPLGALPTTYVIDRSGQVRYAGSRAMGIDELNQVLVPLLRQPQP